jgi:hypothetical protein
LDEMKQVGHVMREGRSRGRRLIGSCTRAAWQLVSTREIVSRELDEMKQFWTKWNSSRSTRSQAGWFFRDQGRISVLLKCGNVRYTLNNAIISGGYYKVRFSAEIAKKCDLVRKLLKSAISHWPHLNLASGLAMFGNGNAVQVTETIVDLYIFRIVVQLGWWCDG